MTALVVAQDVALSRALDKAAQARGYAEAYVVDSPGALAQAQDDLRAIKAEAKVQTAIRDSYLEGPKLAIQRIKDGHDPAIKGLLDAEATLKSKCAAYVLACEQVRRLEAARAAELVATQAPAPEQRAALTRVDDAAQAGALAKGVTLRDRWVATVVDASRVPDKYFVRVVDERAIQAAVQAGAREIPGVEIKNVPVMTVRSV